MMFIRYLSWCFAFLSVAPLAVSADTVMFRDNVGQFIGTILSDLSQPADSMIMDVSGIVYIFRKADVIYFIKDGVRYDLQGQAPSVVSPFPASATAVVSSPLMQLATEFLQSPTQFVSGMITTPTGSVLADPNAIQPLIPVVVPKGKAYQVMGDGIRFRQGPSLEYQIVSTLPGRSILLELETTEGWLHAKTLEGVEGWVHLNFVQPLKSDLCMVTGDNLNVREAPGEIYRTVARLRRGDLVLKLDERADWWFVLVGESVAGWCSASFLQPLTDEKVWKPPMVSVHNSAAGLPVLIQRSPSLTGQQKLIFTIRDENITIQGVTKICLLHHDAALFGNPTLNYVSEAILQRQRLATPIDILNSGLPEDLALTAVGADVLTMLGFRVLDGWQYELTLPDSPTITFAFVVQRGPNRGSVVTLP